MIEVLGIELEKMDIEESFLCVRGSGCFGADADLLGP